MLHLEFGGRHGAFREGGEVLRRGPPEFYFAYFVYPSLDSVFVEMALYFLLIIVVSSLFY
jgi:hypothetical protein